MEFTNNLNSVNKKDSIVVVNESSSLGKILEYIKTTSWFFDITSEEESLFFYTCKFIGQKRLMEKGYGTKFIETLLIFKEKGYPIKLFNSNQAKVFHAYSESLILKDPEIILKYLEKNDKLWNEISSLSDKLKESIEYNNLEESKKIFRKLVREYKVYGYDFPVIFSLGMKLTQNKNKFKQDRIVQIIQKHDYWRNNVTFKEEKLGETIYYYLEYLIKIKKLQIKPQVLMKYLSSEELLDFVDDNLNNILEIINRRISKGYVFAGLRENIGIIEDEIQIKLISDYIEGLRQKNDNSKVIRGEPTFISNEIVKGEVIVVRENKGFEKFNFNEKILVMIQTRPHIIPYLKQIKAIITDEGGISCHAAIISREMNKPCIVGTKCATKILKTGDLVEVDTNTGIVKILNKI